MGTLLRPALSLLRVGLALSLALVGVGCVTSVDPARPVVLVVEEGFDPSEVEGIRRAALDWNVHFGTQLLVQGPGESLAGEQRVTVYESPRVCLEAPAITEGVGSMPDVGFCVDRSYMTMGASTGSVMRHELGHVLNIQDHASSWSAVMSQGTCFKKEDVELFDAANPGFRWRPEYRGPRLIPENWSSSRASTLLGGDGALWHLLKTGAQPLLRRRSEGDAAQVMLQGTPAGSNWNARIVAGKLWLTARDGSSEPRTLYVYDAKSGAQLASQVIREDPRDIVMVGGRTLALLQGTLWEWKDRRLSALQSAASFERIFAHEGKLHGYHSTLASFEVSVYDEQLREVARKRYPIPYGWFALDVAMSGGTLVAASSAPVSDTASARPSLGVLRVDLRGGLGGGLSRVLPLPSDHLEEVRIVGGVTPWVVVGRGLNREFWLRALEAEDLLPLTRWRQSAQSCVSAWPEVFWTGKETFLAWQTSGGHWYRSLEL